MDRGHSARNHCRCEGGADEPFPAKSIKPVYDSGKAEKCIEKNALKKTILTGDRKGADNISARVGILCGSKWDEEWEENELRPHDQNCMLLDRRIILECFRSPPVAL